MSFGEEWRSAARSGDSATAVGWTDNRPSHETPARETRPPHQPGARDHRPPHEAPVRPTTSVSHGGRSEAPSRTRRRAKLAVRRIDPWSVLKFSLVFSIVLCIVLVVAVAILYFLLSSMGVFESINATIGSFQVKSRPLFTARGVIGVSLLIGLADIFLLTAVATLSAFAYNLCADLVGGIEVILAEHE